MDKVSILSVLLLVSGSCLAMEQQNSQIQYSVYDGKTYHRVKQHDADPFLQRIKPEQLTEFLAQGNRIKAVRLDNGDWVVRHQVDGKGGLLGSAFAAYWAIKTVTIATAVAVGPFCPVCSGVIAVAGTVAAVATAAALVATPTP